ncbi:MAG: amidophosphoribosyltransferase [Clostridiales bacterium]|jgi:amidophosphoribosyltransferase|nr:amidophosphoribosyltransferase [Clostridiales bacterium]
MISLSSKLHEECGVFGIFGDDVMKPASAAYYGLFALQHRGQESCGIAVSDMGVLKCRKDMGLVGEVFSDKDLEALNGHMAIGHVRYSTMGGSCVENCQPFLVRHSKGRLAIAHNGNLTNAEELRGELALDGAMFQTTTDSEVIAHIIARERTRCGSMEQAVANTVKRLKGAFSMLVMSPRKLIAVRDSLGFRPLVLGRLGNSYIFASETCALDAIGAQRIRDIEPGEIVVISAEGINSIRDNCSGVRKICIFEYIYFARPDSVIDGIEVHASRIKAGRLLAQQYPANADIVIGVPDSGLDAALGFSRASGIEYSVGFTRNNYVGRTFIKPEQSQRRASVDIKLNVLTPNIRGKKVVMVDDSIVRGSTTVNIIKALKKAGAKEVHVRISSPTIHWPCYFGTDIPTREELTSNHNSVDRLCRLIGADSLAFLKVESLCELIDSKEKTFCDACFTGNYPDRQG